jgi:uncharacterized protein with von Willebrand factor type A (vWA) domain
MSYLEELIAKAQKGDAFWDDPRKPPARTEKNSVQPDAFDRQTWAWITDAIPTLAKQVDDLGEDFETSPWAYEDLFYLMYKAAPDATPEDVLVEEFKPQALMMSMIGDSDELRHLRHETMLDDYNTAFAMLTMRDRMRKAFEDLQEAMAAAAEADQEIADALAAAQQALASGEGVPEAVEGLEQALAARAAAQGDATESAEEAASSIRGAADRAAQSIEEERTLTTSWGIGPGKLQRMSFEERRALSERLNASRMAKFAKMLGAQRLSADAEIRRSLRRAPTRTADTELGRDLSRLTADEMAKMTIPELADDFELRYVKRRLRLKKFNAPPKMDRGPVVLVCDESYSMSEAVDADGNTREMWSKAVALALCDAARRGKRDFIYIGFASIREQWQTRFLGGNMGIDEVVKFTEHFFAGGTHYETPLRMAMSVCLEYASAHKPKPDIVFVTDDDCRVPDTFVEEWAKVRHENDVRCYGIQVGGSADYNTMQTLTDRQLSITSLNANPEGVAEIFRSL